MIEQTRIKLIQEINQLKIELDRGNKFKDEPTELKFLVTEDRVGTLKLIATTGLQFKLLLEKRDQTKWRVSNTNQYGHLGNWFCDLLKYENNVLKTQVTIQYKVMSLYRY